MTELLTAKDIARLLACGRTQAYIMLERGEIPSLKIGRLRRCRPQDLEVYIAGLVEGTPVSAPPLPPARRGRRVRH